MASVSAGVLELRTTETSIAVSAGEVLFLPDGNLLFPLQPVRPGSGTEFCLVLFNVEAEDAALVEGLVKAGVQTLKPGLGFTKDQLERRLRSGSPAMRRSGELYLLSFMYDLSDSGTVKSSSAVMDRHLGNAISYMKSHLQDEITLDRLAAAINISKTHLIRIFRKELASSPMRYLTGLRVEESANMLSGTDMTLGQVAEKLNFYSDSHFSKVFKKNMGENPSAYRHTYIDSLLSKQHKSFEELEKSYLFIQQLIDATDDLIFYKNIEGRYLGCNAAFCQFAGLARKDIVGKSDAEIFNSAMAKEFEYNDKMVLEGKRTHRNEEWIQYKDGTKVLVEVSKSPFFGLRDEVGGTIGISRDITYRRMAEERLLIAKEEAETGRRDTTEESLSVFRVLSLMIAHSSEYLALLRLSENDPEKLFMIEKVIRESDLMENILIAFTGMKEMEIGVFPLDEGLFSLKEISADSTRIAEKRFPHLETRFEDGKDIPILLKGSKGALLKIVMSLITHIAASGAQGVAFFCSYENQKLSICATDDGPRLMGNRTKLFKIQNGDTMSENRTWDVNLSLCQDLVEYLNGEWNISNNETGVTFTMTIPMRRGAV